jgi:hypothetical protein
MYVLIEFLGWIWAHLLLQVGVRQSAQIPPDIRAYSQALLTSLPSQLLIPYLYPSFYSLHNMPPEVRPFSFTTVLNIQLNSIFRLAPLANKESFCLHLFLLPPSVLSDMDCS